ncbi:hypothetical protein [Streptomyces sp. CMB-StM0423]|uniref:hypothetical protein n=1 Tax=Streptomyces sp. CMB-StM0423 TaxID=2059884 RepID=UPI000C7083A2|nr:hypothetical protein [Streptomyces sp. CMB-StM0423]AUH39102.1 hypothetical protein CXR04_01500 [Streptomyces sp. CMB-StM0423]
MSSVISVRSGAVITAGVLLVASLTSCANYVGCGIGRLGDDVTAADLEGRYEGDRFGTLTLKSGGVLAYGGWPDMSGFDWEDEPRTSGVGRWELGAGEERGTLSVGLEGIHGRDYRGPSGMYSLTLEAEGSADDLQLAIYLGDPDTCDLNTFDRIE